MTDDEIIKALKCCKRSYIKCNKDCPRYYVFYDSISTCKNMLIKESLDLINRQKAENESLKVDLAKYSIRLDNLYKTADEIKSEAIKEFAERLQNALYRCDVVGNRDNIGYITSDVHSIIDNLVKEMTEVNENDKM